MRATLTDVLRPAMAGGYGVAGLVCLGWEDARAYVAAAESLGAPVILQAGPGARAHMPVTVWGAMFRALAERAAVPVVAHLDHGAGLAECVAGIEAGFSSVMFDGSRLGLAENIETTAQIAEVAHRAGVSLEAELGFVGYAAGAQSQGTDSVEAVVFAQKSGADALAVSVGNVHLMQQAGAAVDWARLQAVEACGLPLVIHGGSGICAEDRLRMVAGTVSKINIGTELRQAFGSALRGVLAADLAVFDRLAILNGCAPALEAAGRAAILSCGWKAV